MILPQQSIGDWEERARLFIVRCGSDVPGVGEIVSAIEDQLGDDPAEQERGRLELDKARAHQAKPNSGRYFLMMFVWDASIRAFRPFITDAFIEKDWPLQMQLSSEMVDLSLRYRANGIKMRTFGAPPQALTQRIFDECLRLTREVRTSMASRDKH